MGVSGAGNVGYMPNSGGSGTDGSTGDYRLDLSLDMSDTLAAAKVTSLVGPGSVVAQEFARLGNGQFDSLDVDFYQFNATANSVLMAVTSQPPGSDTMDTHLRLFASDGTPLATENSPADLYSRLHYVFSTSGTFYIGVSGAGNAVYDPHNSGTGAPGTTGDYRLDLTLTALSADELELSTLMAANADGSQGFAVAGIIAQSWLGGHASISPSEISTGMKSMTSFFRPQAIL